MRTVVKKLRSEIETGNQISTILDITSNGNDLICKDKVDSPECLELLIDFYED